MRVESGKKTCARLTATCLGDKCSVEANALVGKLVKIGSTCISISITPKFRTIVFGDNQQDIRRSCRRPGGGENAWE